MTMNMKLHFALAFVLRIIILILGYIQDAFWDVKYTDVDYFVFTDAARYVSQGLSPFNRHTYRYTPMLAYLLLPNITISNAFGKVLFSALDILTSMLIMSIQRKVGFKLNVCRICTFLWLYNPMTIVISTRGNAESIMTFLIVLFIYFHQAKKPLLSGIVYGLSVHFKIYPCIYALSLYFTFTVIDPSFHGWKKCINLVYPSKEKLIFVFSSLLGFLFPTLVSFVLYRDDYLEHALLYHLTRKDIRHNFSPYFYILYLSESADPRLSTALSLAAFVLQAILIAFVSWIFVSPQLLPACMFLQTFVFVTFNKVCTSQYFIWYLCLFPLSYPLLKSDAKLLVSAFVIWLLGQGLWLMPAYFLEFQGQNMFIFLCISGLLFFTINVYLICLFIKYLNVVNVKQIKSN